MSDLVRVSLSIEKDLFDRLEKLVKDSGYTNRSEFVRDIVRNRLVEKEWSSNRKVLATVTLVYDHETRLLSKRLTHLQHEHFGAILATTHVHLGRRLCAEMIMIQGRAREIKHLAESLGREKGVLHATLSMSSTGKGLS
ncbi:MAG: nickel-responsive transcriptional regulator NikR [Planctomycetes bacterium]|nr:nickel-responsive transcriptional regulator NikR [Planctomycetota bacterium]